MAEERKSYPTDAAQVKAGDLMAIVQYVKVERVSPTANEMQVAPVNKPDQKINVIGRDLITDALSADYFKEEVKTTMTDVAEKLIASHNRPLTVCFVKQDDTERVLRGRLLSHEAVLGRSYVEDMDQGADPKNRVRLVDHRTIKYLVVDGVKYTVKGKK